MTRDAEERLRSAARDVELSLSTAPGNTPDVDRLERRRRLGQLVGAAVVLLGAVALVAQLTSADDVHLTTEDPLPGRSVEVTFPDGSTIQAGFGDSLADASFSHAELSINVEAVAPEYRPLQAWLLNRSAEDWADRRDAKLQPLESSGAEAALATGAGLQPHLLIENPDTLLVVALPSAPISETEDLATLLVETLRPDEVDSYPVVDVRGPFSIEQAAVVFSPSASPPADETGQPVPELRLIASPCSADQTDGTAHLTGMTRRCYAAADIVAALDGQWGSLEDLTIR